MQSPTAAEIIYRLKIAGKNKFEKELEGEIDSKKESERGSEREFVEK